MTKVGEPNENIQCFWYCETHRTSTHAPDQYRSGYVSEDRARSHRRRGFWPGSRVVVDVIFKHVRIVPRSHIRVTSNLGSQLRLSPAIVLPT